MPEVDAEVSKGPRFIEVSHGVIRPAGIENQLFIKLDDLPEWRKRQQDHELYSSVFRFYTEDPYVGGVLASFPMDFDNADNPKKAQKEALAVCRHLINVLGIKEEDISICFSGNKGFHVFVNHEVFGGKREKGPLKPNAYLPKIFKNMVKELIHQHGLKTLDLSIYDRRRLMRLQNSRHETTGLYKIPLSLTELETLNVDQIRARAGKKKPPLQKGEHKFSRKAGRWYKRHYDQFMKWLKERKIEFTDGDLESGEVWPCVKKRLEIGAEKGTRNQCTLELASYFCKKGVPLSECLQTLKTWYEKLDQSKDFRTWEDCERTIRKSYEVGGYTIGCGSEFIHDLCVGKENCPQFVKIEETKFSKEILEKAEEILIKDPLQYVADTVNLIHVGDLALLKIAYISALSAQLAKPIHLWPIGTSQKGKSHSLYSLRYILPKELFTIFTSASPKALFYYAKKYGENCFDGKLIFIDEIETSKLTLPMLRSLTSPTDIEPRHLSVYDADLLDLKIKGPRTIWFTSVKAFGADQLRNRFVFVNPDETEIQDEKVFELQKNEESALKPQEDPKFQVAQAITKNIVEKTKSFKVEIPYVDKIVWPYKERRWLFPTFKSFIQTITKINYKHRKQEIDKITSTPEDFAIAKELWKNFDKILIYRVSNPAKNLLDQIPTKKDDAKTTADLSETIGKSTRQTSRLLDELEDAQLINKRKRQREGPGRLAWEYWKAPVPNVEDIKLSEGDITEWLIALPDIENLISDISDIGLEPVKIKQKNLKSPKVMSKMSKIQKPQLTCNSCRFFHTQECVKERPYQVFSWTIFPSECHKYQERKEA